MALTIEIKAKQCYSRYLGDDGKKYVQYSLAVKSSPQAPRSAVIRPLSQEPCECQEQDQKFRSKDTRPAAGEVVRAQGYA
jgi:hypothetical protein